MARTGRSCCGQRADAARQHRPALDAELRRACSGSGHTAAGGGKVFAGQRDDPFFVDLGSIFDLAGLRPFNPFHLIPLAADAGVDALKNYNTHSIVLQIPIADAVKIPNTNIGVYASASRSERTILKKDGTTKSEGQFVQISRLGIR